MWVFCLCISMVFLFLWFWLWGMSALWLLGFLLLFFIFSAYFVGVLLRCFLYLFVVLLLGAVCIVVSWFSFGVFFIFL